MIKHGIMNVTSLMTAEIKIDRGASLRGALRTGNSGGTGKEPQGKSVSLYLLRRRSLTPATYIQSLKRTDCMHAR